MGQAKLRQIEAQRITKVIDTINKEALAQALSKTMQAITHIHAADCIQYAQIGTSVLNYMGVPARAVAGFASWRVGPGDADVVSHDPGMTAGASISLKDNIVMFHAWIELDGVKAPQIVDFTTFQLREKAQALDAADGGKTQVDFCPTFIWQDAPAVGVNAHAVAQAPNAGVFSYRRDKHIEQLVFEKVDREMLESHAHATLFVYKKILAGEPLNVIGIDTQTGELQIVAPKLAEKPELIMKPRISRP